MAVALACGCGAATRSRPTEEPGPERVVQMEPLRITASRDGQGGYEFEVYDAPELFRAAMQHLEAERCEQAAALFDRVAEEFPESVYASPALYNAGLCLQRAGQPEAAAERYRELRSSMPDSPDVKVAGFQLAKALFDLDQSEELVEVADELLANQELSPAERLEALARRAQGVLGLGELEEAARQARALLSYYRTRPEQERIPDPYFAAAGNYVLAETLRLRSEGLAFPRNTEAQKQVLVRRAELILEAQREYFNTIGFRDSRWAAAAGYRIGHMYDTLWHAIMQAPIPEHLPEEGHAVYRQELAKLVKPLIRHAVRYWELTLMMIERTGLQGDWAGKTRRDLERVRSLLLEQPPGPGGLPDATAPGSTPAGRDAAPPQGSAPAEPDVTPADAGTEPPRPSGPPEGAPNAPEG